MILPNAFYFFEETFDRAMKLKRIPPTSDALVNVIIETPKGGQNS